MKHLVNLVSLFLIVFLINLVTTQPSLAIPSLPSSFYGLVKVNGANVADGTAIQALIGGQVYADGVSQIYQGNSVYALDVRGDNPDTGAQDGGREGDIVQFEVGGVLATQSGTWHSGINARLDVTATASAAPVWTPVPTIPVATPTFTLTSTPTARPSSTPMLTPIPTQQSLPTSTPLPTQGSSPTVQSIQPISPSPVPGRTPTQRPTSTPIQASPSSMILSPAPTEMIMSTEQAAPALARGVQQAVADTELPTATSTFMPISTSVAISKQSSIVAVVPANAEEADAGNAPDGISPTAMLVFAVSAAAIGIGLVLWSIRRPR